MNLFERLGTSKITPPSLAKGGHFVVDNSMGISLLTAYNYIKNKDKYLLITSNLYTAQNIINNLLSLLPSNKVALFPADELLRAETLAQSKEMMAQRLFVLNQIINDEVDIVVANLSSATRYLPDIDLFKQSVINLKVNNSYNLASLKRQLVEAGYLCVGKIDQSFQFASRGDILDVFSINYDYPIRIEFFGDEIESIRLFDIAKQTSFSKIDEVTILPATDMLLTESDKNNAYNKVGEILEKDKDDLDFNIFTDLRDNMDLTIDRIITSEMVEKDYKLYSLLGSKTTSIFDYCSSFKKIIVESNAVEESNKLLQSESLEYLHELFEDGKCISHLEMFKDIHRLIDLKSPEIVTTSTFYLTKQDNTFRVDDVPYKASKKEDTINVISNYLKSGYKTILCLSSKEHLNTIIDYLNEMEETYEMVKDLNIPKSNVGLSIFNLQSGFALPDERLVFISDKELFNDRVRTSRYDSRFKEATILKSYEDLEPGDYVVHEYQGIGQFIQLQTLEVDGVTTDFIKIAYFGGEILYVPLSQFQLIRKYIGKEGAVPRLSHLHGKDWENTKKKIKERINDLANRLMALYIERGKVKGFAFQKDDEFQKEFESKFEHKLTADQENVLKEIKSDMESEHPMDRLLCGDVGFGKTEVAFRAAFKAILSGKQVAILCPTTLLARQHYELALSRFQGFDVGIAMFSRYISEQKIKENLLKVKEGKIHLIIGTHKILSKEMVFNDLGLLIIDEEQRFGVEQKEKIKELKNSIDVLTLSATPIPRTLQISLLGVRSLSVINTAPKDRMPIQTYVTPYKAEVVKELIERELGRKGQVFYLHNNVSNILECAARLQRMIPKAIIGVAHGQMSSLEIEDIMTKFYNGEIDVLVCTTIIENGIDVPNANMIIVEDSEHYGLSQLYQIKGRVGRSDKIAYAYLMFSPSKILTEKAQKRLKSLAEFTELGSGYKIAQRDLMIRGAGDILGPEQAGFIDSIGLDMYIKLLNESVKEKMEGVVPETVKFKPELSLKAFIPNAFAKDSDKIQLYQEIISATTLESLSSIKQEVIDIYGKLPEEVETLFTKCEINILSDLAEVETLKDNKNNIEITIGDKYLVIKGIGNIIFEAMIPFLSKIKISYISNKFKILLNKNESWIKDLKGILKSLANILEKNSIIEVV